MSSAIQNTSVLRLTDNCFLDPQEKDQHRVVSAEKIKQLLNPYSGKSLNQWAELGVIVYPEILRGQNDKDDEADKSELFTLACRDSRTWINTFNCMGVVRLRDQNGNSVQIEIGSRFDEGKNQFFLNYLLSRVFGGSMIDEVDLGADSLWDMLLAYVFRRRLLAASAVGLFKKYQTFHHNDSRIRGRIDINEHLRRNIPFCGKVAYSTHEITFNNPTNHLIRHALAKASRKWGRLLTGDGLMDVRRELEQNTPTWQPGDVVNCILIKENCTPITHPFFHAAYEPLRQVSQAILRDEGASLYQQQQVAEGVIFDGSWLWEEYLWTLLRDLGFKHTDNKKKMGGWKTAPGVTFYPDFFHKEKRIILDAKYKRAGNVQEDARQVFGYMFLLNAINGGLIKPDGNPEGHPDLIDRSQIAVNAEFAKWHDFVLRPSGEFRAGDFVADMNRKEQKFRDRVRSSLNL